MTERAAFTLVPFDPLPGGVDLSVSGTLTRRGTVLSIVYLLAGDVAAVDLPPLNTGPDRKDRLWEQTCLEFFLTVGPEKSDRAAYWEFNLSPTGCWNVFSLAAYRQGLREEKAFSALPFVVSRSAAGLRLEVSVDLGVLLPSDAQWLLGVSAVVVLVGGEETFWAIAHPAPEADFHHSGSFAIALSS